MRILWIGKGSVNPAGGDEVYDRKVLAFIRETHDVDIFHPEPATRLKRLINLAAGIPIHRASYYTRENVIQLKRLIAKVPYDAVVTSWEPFDFLANYSKRNIVILHNMTSDAICQIFPENLIARLYSARVRRWESKLYRRHNIAALIVLSQRDADIVRQHCDIDPIVAHPGSPPQADLSDMAEFKPEIVISGTYDWLPKRRDLKRLAHLYSQLNNRPKVRYDVAMPRSIMDKLTPKTIHQHEFKEAIRIGIIPDTFSAGHKLKSTFYIAQNCVVASFSDVASDFRGLPHSALFIRRVRTMSDLAQLQAELEAMDPQQLRDLFSEFKEACLRRFDWQLTAATISKAIESIDRRAATNPEPSASLH